MDMWLLFEILMRGPESTHARDNLDLGTIVATNDRRAVW